jgi:hypothetical protein
MNAAPELKLSPLERRLVAALAEAGRTGLRAQALADQVGSKYPSVVAALARVARRYPKLLRRPGLAGGPYRWDGPKISAVQYRPVDALLTLQVVAHACRVTDRTVRTWTSSGVRGRVLPTRIYGGRTVVNHADLVAFLDGRGAPRNHSWARDSLARYVQVYGPLRYRTRRRAKQQPSVKVFTTNCAHGIAMPANMLDKP